MNDISIRATDCLRWIVIGQGAMSGALAVALTLWAMCYYFKAGALRRFTFVTTFCPGYLSMFAYVASDLYAQLGLPITWRVWSGLAAFSISDFAMFVLLGHLIVKRELVHEEIRNYTILHDPLIELGKAPKPKL